MLTRKAGSTATTGVTPLFQGLSAQSGGVLGVPGQVLPITLQQKQTTAQSKL